MLQSSALVVKLFAVNSCEFGCRSSTGGWFREQIETELARRRSGGQRKAKEGPKSFWSS